MNLPVAVFTYKIDDLLEEVTKRTSYLGKMRGTEQELHLLDRLSLTKGENFMFKEFLDNSINETYEWVKAFGRNVEIYDKYALEYKDVAIYKNYGVYAEDTNGNELDFDKRIKLNVTNFTPMLDTISVSFDGFSFSQRKDSDTAVAGSTAIVNVKYEFKVYSKLGGMDVKEYYTTTDKVNSNSQPPTLSTSFPFEFDECGNTHNVQNIEMYVTFEVEPNSICDIKKDTYVEYRTDFSDDNVYKVYKVTKDCTNADWKKYAKEAPVDPRGTVVYILERKEHFDENMISSIDRSLKEAMVNHIIFQWFEYVNTPEAERFLLKFEEYGQKAQMGMNTRTKDIQRKYKLF